MSVLENIRREMERRKAEAAETEKAETQETDLQPLVDAASEYKELLLKHNGDTEAAGAEFVKNRMERRRRRLSSEAPIEE